MTDKRIHSPEELRKLLRYEPETGKLFWLFRPKEMFKTLRDCTAWNTRYAGKEALTTVTKFGHRQGKIQYQNYLAHRVVWALQTGEWPPEQIDHANGAPSDNRWGCLRLANSSENSRNTKIRSDNKSGVKGVSWSKRQKKWQAKLTLKGRTFFLGYYSDITDAAAAYAEAAKKYHGEFARIK